MSDFLSDHSLIVSGVAGIVTGGVSYWGMRRLLTRSAMRSLGKLVGRAAMG